MLGDEAVAGGDGVAKGEEGALGVKDVVEVGEAVQELVLRQAVGFARGGLGGEQGFATGVFASVCGQRRAEFGDGGKDGLLVVGQGLLLQGGLGLDVGADGAAVEERQAHGGKEVPKAAGGADEVAAGKGFEADGAGEDEGGVTRGLGVGDEGGLRGKEALGAADVGSAAQEFGGDADEVLRWDFGDGLGGGEFWGEFAGKGAGEDGEGVEEGLFARKEEGDGGAGLLEDVTGLLGGKAGGDAGGVAGGDEVEGLGLEEEVGGGDVELAAGGLELDVGDGGLGGEGDPGLGEGGLVGLEGGGRGVGGEAVAAEEVEFPRGVETGAVDVADAGAGGAVFGVGEAGEGGAGVEVGQERGAGALVTRAGFADGGLRGAKGAVGGEGGVDEGGEDGVVEVVPPRGGLLEREGVRGGEVLRE